MADNDAPLFCDRCMKELTPGRGELYVAKIEAIADPTPPVFEEGDFSGDLRLEINELVAQLEDVSERESMDQVHRRVTIFLCAPCYREWIENPAG